MIYIDKDARSLPKEFFLNSFIKKIDSKFSNLKANPFELVDLNLKAEKLKNICITDKLDDLEKSEWIILENKPFKNKFNDFAKNGFLLLDLNYNLLKHNTLNEKLMMLSIVKLDQISKNCKEVFKVNLKCEIGINNNINKILLNYSIFLVKFLKNSNSFSKKRVYKTSSFKLTFKSRIFNKFKFLFYYFNLMLKIFLRKLKKQQLNWKIGIKKNGVIKFLEQPKNSFWADPFIVIGENGNSFVYFEELKNDSLGKISCVEINSKFEIVDKQDIINTNYHLSFPNVFLIDGNYYMIPESSQNSTLQLYKCTKLPFQWEFKLNLMENIKLLDATWIHHDGLYWIFANKIEDFEYDNNEKLYLYYSDDLFSNKWKSHIKNPIVTDASLARNAGNFILNNGKLIRPSQNCFNGYGKNVVMNEVKVLNTEDYIEEKIKELFPVKGAVGAHTINSHEDLCVMDFLVKE
ncbi:hypothetical protein GCM10007962_24120 [Yeosuana aromativorans]|uniref:Glucosamine inositolphosphorylceramide transferase 1 N-terminal domain-containing protein n=2 Tax=Yeosuana aromativorans TaxID=288019 RepID=A0A8J3FHH0_9FLAO|nr:hypothetical protein GCM10007962_24120 [Yeosuana aromativorans]